MANMQLLAACVLCAIGGTIAHVVREQPFVGSSVLDEVPLIDG